MIPLILPRQYETERDVEMARRDIERTGFVLFDEADQRQKAFRAELVATRARLISGPEAEAIHDLGVALQRADKEIKIRLALAYAESPEDWSYSKLLATRRLEALQASVDAEIAYLNNEAKNITDHYATYAFLHDVEKVADEFYAAGVALELGAAAVDMNVANFYVNYPVDGVVFGERFATMTAEMQHEARKAIVNGLVAGDGVKPITRAVLAVTDLNRSAAETVIRTTAMNASNQAHALVYEKAGVAEVQIDATLDAATCPECFARDGKRIPAADASTISLHPD